MSRIFLHMDKSKSKQNITRSEVDKSHRGYF